MERILLSRALTIVAATDLGAQQPHAVTRRARRWCTIGESPWTRFCWTAMPAATAALRSSWALGKIGADVARAALSITLGREVHPLVREESACALAG